MPNYLISHSPTYTYKGIVANNNNAVMVNITRLIKAAQKQDEIYLEFAMKIIMGHIYNSVVEVKPCTLTVAIRITKGTTGL